MIETVFDKSVPIGWQGPVYSEFEPIVKGLLQQQTMGYIHEIGAGFEYWVKALSGISHVAATYINDGELYYIYYHCEDHQESLNYLVQLLSCCEEFNNGAALLNRAHQFMWI
jgi:hypothetical protein